MKGDRLYCLTCKRTFPDIEEFFDTRDGKAKNQQNGRLTKGMGAHHFIEECPFCRSMKTINASAILEKGDKLSFVDVGLKNWHERSIYLILKDITKKDTFI